MPDASDTALLFLDRGLVRADGRRKPGYAALKASSLGSTLGSTPSAAIR